MSISSRLFPGIISRSLIFGVLGGALLLSPLCANAQDAPDVAAPAAVPAAKPVTTAWTTFKGDQQRTGTTTANVTVPLTLQWRYSSVGPARSYNTTPLVIGAPGNQLVVFASGGVIYATDVNTGAQVWKSPEAKSSISLPLTLLSTDDGDLILALQNSGRLAAYKTADGTRAWEVDCGALATESGPIIVETRKGTRIICALNSGKMVAVDSSGAIDPDWKMQLGQIGTAAASSMSLSRDGSRLFIMGSDARLYIINVREARVLYSILQPARSAVTPISGKDTVFTANGRRVSAWRLADGTAAWTANLTSEVLGSPALKLGENGASTGSTLFFGTRDGKFMAVNALDGKVKWQKNLLDKVGVTGSPLVTPSAVIVGTAEGSLVGFAPDSGDIVWQYRLQTERVRDLTPKNTSARGGRRNGRDGEGGDLGAVTDANAAPEEKRTYGVSSAPAAIDQKIFVLGDDAALYAFTSQNFDADPPRVVEPSITLNASDRKLLSLLISEETPQVVPGVGPFYFAAQIDDVGSGVDPESIVVSLNDKPLDAARVFYGRARSVLTVTLVDVDKGDPALEDGLKKIVITAKDYAGNTLNYRANFSVDNTVPAPAAPVEIDTQNGNIQGGGNFQN